MAYELYHEDFSTFFKVPFAVYGDDYPFVSPLRGDLKAMLDFKRNPFFGKGDGTYWSVVNGNRPVGRMMVAVHKDANERFKEKVCNFGFFDVENNRAVSSILFGAAQTFALARGCTKMRGNMNMTANQEIGILVKGEQNAPFLAQSYNPEYIGLLLEDGGFRPTKQMTTFIHEDLQGADPEAMLGPKHHDVLDQGAYVFRTFDPARFDDEIEAIREVLNAAMQGNYLFVPLTAEQARFQFGSLRHVLDPTLVHLAEHQGEVVGVTVCVPDVVPLLQKIRSRLFPFGWWTLFKEKKTLRGANVITIMVKPDHQSAGLTRILTSRMLAALKQGDYTRFGSTWVSDNNIPGLKSARALGMTPYHKLALYEKSLL